LDFTFSDEQEDLRRAVRGWLDRHATLDHLRAMEDDAVGITADRWNDLVALGWTSLLVPETHGGGGGGLVDAVPVLEEMGRVPFPGPYSSSAVLATLAASRLGLVDRLASLAAGTTRGTVAVDERGHGDPVDRIRTRATRRNGRWCLSGLKPVVPDGHSADWCLVPARTQAGIQTFVIDGPAGELVPSWDPFRRLARLDLDDRPAEPVGRDGDHTAMWRRIVDDAAVAVCAELVGSMERANELAVDYAKARIQFDRPIATFQVIKHKAADMLHRLELARVGTHYAAWASDADVPDRARAASMAKAYVAEAAVHVSGECIQIHGGVGFTWECQAHLHYRKAKQADLLLGAQAWHRTRVADDYLSA
jgi:alkylation response protein AidB-like acyl-CoA dehydrogenase